MKFNDFPVEIICKIISFFPLRDRFKFRRVCQLWSKLVFVDVKEFAIGTRELANIDRHQSMFSHLFCDNEINRIKLVIFMLTKTKNQLKKLKLSFIDAEHSKYLIKSNEFYQLVNEMILILIQCSRLTSLHFDFDFRLPKHKFEIIFQHLGSQLVELFCEDDSSLKCSYEFSMKYLNSVKVRKLAIDCMKTEKSIEQLLKRFPYLILFRFGESQKHHLCKNLLTLEHLYLLPNMTEFFSFNMFEHIFNASKCDFAQNLISLGQINPSRLESFDFYEKFISLKHLQIISPKEQQMAAIVKYLPHLERLQVKLYEHYYYPNKLDVQNVLFSASCMKNLQMLEFDCQTIDFHELQVNPMPNLKFLFINLELKDLKIDAQKMIVRLFPNIKILDIQCGSFQPDIALILFSKLHRLNKLRLHTQNHTEDDRSVENSLFAHQQVKSFCDQNGIEFLWSHYNRYYEQQLTKDHKPYSYFKISSFLYKLVRSISRYNLSSSDLFN